MASSQYFDEEDEWDRTEQALASMQLNIPEPPQLITPPDPPSTGEDYIDSALLNALNNNRERMVLFQIEDMLLRFVQSPERSFEVPSGLNSFRRLLVYRLAVRFGLVHITSEQQNEIGERTITIYKTPTTSIPKVLLIDYNDRATLTFSPTQAPPQMEKKEGALSLSRPDSVAAVVSDTSSASPPPMSSEGSSKKVLVMKRQTSNSNGAANKSQDAKPQMSAEEREKAYQEARARIFGGAEGGIVSGESSKRESPAATKSSSPAPYSEHFNEETGSLSRQQDSSSEKQERREGGSLASSSLMRKERINKSSSGNNLAYEETPESIPPAAFATMKRSSSNPQVQTMNEDPRRPNNPPTSRGKGKLVDVGSWKENKSQVRNVEAEKSDPDFVRRGSPSVAVTQTHAPVSESNKVYGAVASGSAGGVAYDPRQMYPQYVAPPPAYNQATLQYGAYPNQMYMTHPYPSAAMPMNNFPYPYSSDGMWNQSAPQYEYGNNPPSVPQSYGNPNEPWQQQVARGQTSPYSRTNPPPTNYGRGPSVNNRQDFPPLG